MNEKVDKAFIDMVDNLLSDELCDDFDPAILHGFMGLAGEGGELLNMYTKFIFYHGEPFDRTEYLIELADTLFFMQVILNCLGSSIEELQSIGLAKLLTARYPNGYSHDKAITHHRDKKAERAAVDKVVDTFAKIRENEDLRGELYGETQPEIKYTCSHCKHFVFFSKSNCAIVGYGTQASNSPCKRFELKNGKA